MQKNAGDCAERTPNARTNPVHDEAGCSGDVREIETPGALVGATEGKEKADKLHGEGYPTRLRAASAIPLIGPWNRRRWDWLDAVLDAPHLSDRAKVMAAKLVTKAASNASGRCFWSNAQFAARLHYSLSKVKRGFGELEEAEFLVVEGGQGKSLRKFHFLMPLSAPPQPHDFDCDGPPDEDATAFVPPPAPARSVSVSHHRQTVPRASATPLRTIAGQPDTTLDSADEREVPSLETATPDHSERVKSDPIKTRSEPRRKGHFAASKGSDVTPSYIIPKKFQNTRERAREAEPQTRPASGAHGAPRKPRLNLVSVAHHGSDREAAWNSWLGKNGFPDLSALRIRSSDKQGAGWEIPYRYPPTEHNAFEIRTARAWAEWATATMETRNG
ncbi:hypothetical protein BDE18_1595 [Paracoccus pantotrophus]|uniref:Helix-turn-helix domain-containing protein n=1 Tax=Paracoccus pantotrophus TaxID=82367 RepID=A0AAE6NYA3_PARPN|nr:hypothetical protein [Paracoccus pantotrophus]QFG37292.1 hypothetical protein ESD82_14070 [Paracoccus pantotrophus]RKS52276.1 hypothetical protein BDE18_1595 [Paracoccus pantotrophus]